jgi:hypothetical protein
VGPDPDGHGSARPSVDGHVLSVSATGPQYWKALARDQEEPKILHLRWFEPAAGEDFTWFVCHLDPTRTGVVRKDDYLCFARCWAPVLEGLKAEVGEAVGGSLAKAALELIDGCGA